MVTALLYGVMQALRNMSGRLDVVVIDSWEAWGALRQQWNELLAESASDNFFLTWEWLASWAEAFLGDRKLFIHAFYEDGQLIGIAPWCLRLRHRGMMTLKQIEFLGVPEGSSDYLDIFCARGREKDLADYIYNMLFAQGKTEWHSLLLRNIPAESVFLLHFLNEVEQAGKYYLLTPAAYCPIVKLPDSAAEVINRISPKRKKRLMQEWRMMTRQGAVRHAIIDSTSPQWNEALERFFRLYRLRWNGTSTKFLSFLTILAKKTATAGSMRIDFLEAEGLDIAAIVHFRYRDGLFGYLQAVDHSFNSKVSAGSALIRLSLEQCVDDRIRYYDFLGGSEDFKFIWANHGRRLLSLSLKRCSAPTFLQLVERSGKDIMKLVMR